jgi:hypothetical protein
MFHHITSMSISNLHVAEAGSMMKSSSVILKLAPLLLLEDQRGFG